MVIKSLYEGIPRCKGKIVRSVEEANSLGIYDANVEIRIQYKLPLPANILEELGLLIVIK